MRLSSKIMIFLAIAIVGVFTWGYFSGDLPAPLPSYKARTTTTPPTSTTTTQTADFQLNKPFTFGNARYIITGIDRTAASSGNTTTTATTAGSSYVLVFLTVSNEGMAPLTLSPSDFNLLDNKGRTFTVNQEATKTYSQSNAKDDLLTESLQPGLSREGILAFDVPGDSSGFSLRLSNGYVSVDLGQ